MIEKVLGDMKLIVIWGLVRDWFELDLCVPIELVEIDQK